MGISLNCNEKHYFNLTLIIQSLDFVEFFNRMQTELNFSPYFQIALQGIEFWSNVCDEEVDLQIEASEAAEMGRPPEHVSRFYAKGALQVRSHRASGTFMMPCVHGNCSIRF